MQKNRQVQQKKAMQKWIFRRRGVGFRAGIALFHMPWGKSAQKKSEILTKNASALCFFAKKSRAILCKQSICRSAPRKLFGGIL